MIHQQPISVQTTGRGTTELTSRIDAVVEASGVQAGTCHLFLQHTSAALMLCENADPAVRADLEAFMARLVADGDPAFCHVAEGPDDMPAHVRTILTGVDLTLPVSRGRCLLGDWQGIYLWEHRHAGHIRKLMVTVHGE
jgi:secondary thiamine-phosphate synthase enzyme